MCVALFTKSSFTSRRSSSELMETSDSKTLLKDGAPRSTTSVISSYVESTTTHGPSNILNARTKPEKLWWSMLFAFGLSMVAYNVYGLVSMYLTFPTATTVEIISGVIDFPAVTICNANAFRLSKLDNVKGFRQTLEKYSTKKSRKLTGSSSSTTAAPTTIIGSTANGSISRNIYAPTVLAAGVDLKDTVMQLNTDLSRYPWFDTAKGQSVDLQIKRAVAILTSRMSLRQKQSMGYQLEEMLQECTFMGKACSPNEFVRFYNRKYGNCYTFNSGLSGTIEKVHNPGDEYGLNLMLAIDQTEYVPVLSSEAAIKVTVHPQFIFPMPEDEAIDVPPGYRASVVIDYEKIEKVPPPFTTCTDGSGLENFYPGNYSQTTCTKTCLQKHVMHHCNCSDFDLPVPKGKTVCATAKQLRCLDHTYHRFAIGEINCNDCAQPCSQSRYDTRVTFEEWPSLGYAEILASALGNRTTLKRVLQNGSSGLRQHLCEINVYFPQLRYISADEQRSYELKNVFADVGGQLGLWLGMSVLSVSEFFELLLVLLVYSCFKRIKRQAKVGVATAESEDTVDAQE